MDFLGAEFSENQLGTRQAMSNVIFLFITIVANKYAFRHIFCEKSKIASSLPEMYKFLKNFHILGHLFSHYLEV
jgi:hypothetical protein